MVLRAAIQFQNIHRPSRPATNAPAKAAPVTATGTNGGGGLPVNTHELNRNQVKHAVERKRVGYYRLGDVNDDGVFVTGYHGRSDRCLQSRLFDHVANGLFSAFQVHVTPTIREAFESECRDWHLLMHQLPVGNAVHPASPRHTNYRCPYCDIGGEA
jgi:hypothetical protein